MAQLKSRIKGNYLYGCKGKKIPHHGSKTAKEIVPYFNKNVDSAVAASFQTCQLPCKSVMDKYKAIKNQVYVTQKTKSEAKDFGMIKYVYSFKDSGVQLHIVRFGNAYKYQM